MIYAINHCLENREPQIAVRSHIAGAVSGVLLGFILYGSEKTCEDDKLKFRILKTASLVCCCCFLFVVIVIDVTK